MQQNRRSLFPADPDRLSRSQPELGLGRYLGNFGDAGLSPLLSPSDPRFGAGTLLTPGSAPSLPVPAQRPPQQPARRASSRAPAPERSIFDIAGRFHDFQAGPKIARPNLAEEFIPVIGPAWSALGDLQDGNYGSAAFNAGAAVTDLLPIGYGIKAVRGAAKVTRALGTRFPKSYAVQKKMHELGFAKPDEHVHHIFELGLGGIKRNVENWRNNPLFLKSLPVEIHGRLHHRVGDLPKFNDYQRLWYGTNAWMKAVAANSVTRFADEIENFGDWLSRSQTSERPKGSR